MKKINLIFTFIILSYCLQAQHSFSIEFIEDMDIHITGFYEESDGSFLATGNVGSFPYPENFRGILTKISPEGDTILRYYNLSDTALIFEHIVKNGSEYLVYGTAFFPPDYYHTAICAFSFDTNLVMQSYQILHTSEGLVFTRRMISAGKNKGHHLICTEKRNISWELFVCRTDKQGKLIRSQMLNECTPDAYIDDAIFIPDSSEIMIVGWGLTTGGQNKVFVDTMYNFLYSALVPEPYGDFISLKNFSGNKYLVSSNHRKTSYPEETSLGIGITDTSFNTDALIPLGTTDTIDWVTQISSSDFIHKDSIYLLGDCNYQKYTGKPSWQLLYQLDSNLNVRSLLRFGGETCSRSFVFKATNDGGCIASIIYYDDYNYEKNNCLVRKFKKQDIITSMPALPEDGKQVNVVLYPNPGIHMMCIQSNISNASISLYNLNGEKQFSFPLNSPLLKIDCSVLKAGTYIYYVEKDGKVLDSGKWVKK